MNKYCLAALKIRKERNVRWRRDMNLCKITQQIPNILMQFWQVSKIHHSTEISVWKIAGVFDIVVSHQLPGHFSPWWDFSYKYWALNEDGKINGKIHIINQYIHIIVIIAFYTISLFFLSPIFIWIFIFIVISK